MIVEINKEYSNRNLISYRDVLEQKNTKEIYEKLFRYINDNDIQCDKDFSISVTHNLINKHEKTYVDLELIWKVNGFAPEKDGIKYINEMRINNAIRCITNGTSQQIIAADGLLKKYISEYKKSPATPFYIITEGDNDNATVTIYIGIKDK